MAKVLHSAKKAKEDEFYTQRRDIDAEMPHYKKHFKDKVVYCNCDDPEISEFFKYFCKQFKELGLKKLISTCYKNDSRDLFSRNDAEKSIHIAYTGDKKSAKIQGLKGDGDFRSKECIELLKTADIVVTNPPFSLFRPYLSQLIQYKKKFLIIGNMNAIQMKEIFPLIMAGKMWLGHNSGNMIFKVPDYYPPRKSRFWMDETGQKWRSMGNTCWFTNLDLKKRHINLDPYKTYNKKDYPKYDNYDAIEVSTVKDIPCDYDGVMGVPLTFLEKHNPDEFEILGCTQRGCHDKVPDTKKYDSYWEMRQDGTKTGSSGGKTNENANVVANDGEKNYFTDGKRVIQSKYGRIFIRNKRIHKS